MPGILHFLVLLLLLAAPARAADPLTPEERTWLTAHAGEIRLAPVPHYPPIDFLDDQGEPAGLSQDYVRRIEERLGFRFQWVAVESFPDLIEKLKNREVDVTTSIGLREERRAFLDFQEPHFRADKVLIIQEATRGIGELADLSGKSLALVEGYEYSALIRQQYPAIRAVPVADETAAIEAVAFGRVNACVADLASATHTIQYLGITNLKVAGTTEFGFDLRMASRNDWPLFTAILAKGLALVTPEERLAIHEHWVHLHTNPFYATRLFWFYAGALLALGAGGVVAVYGWRNALRRRVKHQTLLLQQQLEEQQRAAEALRRSEERFALSMEATDDGLWDWDIPSDAAYFSPAYYRMLGYAPNEFPGSGKAWAERIHPEDRERATATAGACVDGAVERFEIEFRMRTKDGTWHWIQARGKAVARDARGCALRVVGTHIDIAEKKHAEQTRIAEEQKYQRLLESTNTVPWELDLASGRFTYMGPQVEAMTGFPPSHWKDLESWAATLVPEDREWAVTYCQAETAQSRNHDFVYRMRAKDGRLLWIQDIVSVVPGAHGSATLVGFMHDITAAKEAEGKHKASETRYELLFTNMTEAFALHEVLLDAGGEVTDYRWLDVNPAFERETGLSRDQVIGATQSTVLPAEDPFWRETFDKVALGGPPMHVTHYSSVLKKHYEVYIYSPEPLKVAVLFHDVTEKLSLEQRLRQAQKLEAIGTLAGGIAHDFNNILGAIMGYTELSLCELPAGSEVRENLQDVLAASERAKALVQQILSFSRRGEKQTARIEVRRVVAEVLKLLGSVIPKTIAIEADLDPSSGEVRADTTELHQVVMNLCTNAYQAVPQTGGGVLRLRLAGATLGPLEAASIPGLAPGEYARLDVEDNGTGIDEATLARIFDPYFTTKEPGKGTGLGLALVHGIVTGLDGAVTVRSTPGAGTVFTVYLPRISAAGPKAAEAPVGATPHGKGHILLVDDEPAMARLGRKMLESLGYTVRELTDPREALRLFEGDPQGFDVLVTDQTMPGLIGADLVRRTKATRPGMPAVICTGYSDLIDEAEAARLGAAALVRKPYDRAGLGAAVAAALSPPHPAP